MYWFVVLLVAYATAYDWRDKSLQILADLKRTRPSPQPVSAPAGPAPWIPASAMPGPDVAQYDQFGITMLFPSVDPSTDWYASWEEHRFLSKANMNDPKDQRSMFRGNGSMMIGDGEMVMNGDEPRYYVQAPPNGWVDTEFTVYCRVDNWLDADKSAISLISRSRHHRINKNPCDARGYYARFYLGTHRVQLKKEFRHDPNRGIIIYSPGIETIDPLDLHFDIQSKFIGIKSVVTTNPDKKSVKLRMFFDLNEGENGGNWQLVLEYDDVDLEASKPTKCHYEDGGGKGDSSPILRPGQVNFLRADAIIGLHLKSASVRAI